jgi:hypothetical protein
VTRYERQFRSVARSLSHVELAKGSLDDALGLSERDLLDKDAGRRFLDFYGDEGIATALERYGMYRALRARGYDRFEVETRTADDRHTMLLFGRAAGESERDSERASASASEQAGDARHRLLELVVRRDRLVPLDVPGLPRLDTAFDVLTVDWLLLQDPLAQFPSERPRLPGQEHPGLGIGERVLELLYRIVERLGLHALVTVAEHFHNAVLYARELPFFDPVHGGRLRALQSYLMDHERLTLAQASWAIEWGLVRGADDAVLRWKGEAQLRAFAPALHRWLESDAHVAAEERSAAATRVVLDRRWLDEKWASARASLGCRP